MPVSSAPFPLLAEKDSDQACNYRSAVGAFALVRRGGDRPIPLDHNASYRHFRPVRICGRAENDGGDTMTERILGPTGSKRRRRFLWVPMLLVACTALFVIAGAQAVHNAGFFQLDGDGGVTQHSY